MSCSEQSREGMNIDVPPWVSHGGGLLSFAVGQRTAFPAVKLANATASEPDALALVLRNCTGITDAVLAEQSIFSIDVDSVGKKVATAGSDAKVKVWSLRPLLSAAAEQDENRHPQLLATLTEHCAPVNTVRCAP